jgi:hypothetical protein
MSIAQNTSGLSCYDCHPVLTSAMRLDYSLQPRDSAWALRGYLLQKSRQALGAEN